jgi:hypothetical protein
MISYSYSVGYGGELSGISCSVRKRCFQRFELSGSGRFGWYTRASGDDENHNESAVRIGGKYWVKKIWSVGIYGEHITGRRYSSDMRILVKTTLVVKAGK